MQPTWEVERVVESLATAVLLIALLIAVVALIRAGLVIGLRWLRHRHSALAPGETVFVGRWGREGPELFAVGEGVRRLLPPQGRERNAQRREAGEVGHLLAARMLLEILGRPPSRDLAWAFVDERLTCLPVDGFVLPTSDVAAWLDARHATSSDLGGRAVEAAGSCATFVASWFKPATRPTVEDRAFGARKIP